MRAHAVLPVAYRLVLGCVLVLLLASSAAAEPPLRFRAEFPVTEGTLDRVRFWVRVFTEVSQNEAILHDRNDPRLVYDVVSDRPRDEAAIDAVRASYDHVLSGLTVATFSRTVAAPSAERLRVAALFAPRAGPEAYVRAIGNIRAQRGLKEVFADGLARAEIYLPAIRRILRRERLPSELAYMPHVESSFNPNAVSRAGATGLWQITRAAAEGLLKVDGRTDERFDPVRSTEAAAAHLARARSVLGSWPLAIVAYNHGVAGVARARSDVGSDAVEDIIRGYRSPSFGFASQNFYAEFLAAVHVAEHAAFYFPGVRRTPSLQYVVRRGDSLWTIARKHRVSVRALVAANGLGNTRLRRGQLILIRQS
jgi:membrane-bound lytic murein transglycosylase D